MDLTDVLMNEHQCIKQVLDCLEKMVSKVQRDARFEEKPARDAVFFFRYYANRCHHAKEEALLFPVLEAKGLTEGMTLMVDVAEEHIEGRKRVGAMEEAIEGASQGNTDALKRFCDEARAYVQMLRRHIRKEDDFLFPVADIAIDAEEAKELAALVKNTDSDTSMELTVKHCRKIAEDLVTRYGVSRQRYVFGIDQ